MNTVCVIVNYNDAETTIEQLRRISDYESLDAVLIVDNCSSDESFHRLLPLAGGKRMLLRSERNGGYGAGNNLGIRYADEVLRAKRVLIANPDAEFSDACARAMSDFLEAHPDYAVAAPVQKTPGRTAAGNLPGTRENVLAGAAAWPLRPWLYDLLESGPLSRRLFTALLHYPRRRFSGKSFARVDCVPGALLMADVRKLREAGGYDEAVFLYGEEYMLGSRLRLLGYRTALLLQESYFHRHAQTIKKSYAGLLERQKLREKATLHYYSDYLEISPAQRLITKLFYGAVRLEILLFGDRA